MIIFLKDMEKQYFIGSYMAGFVNIEMWETGIICQLSMLLEYICK